MKPIKIKITKLEGNKGQIEGVPRNPRFWSPDDVDNLAKSIEETPELMEARPLIVTPLGNKYVVLAGNMRVAAVRKLGWKDALCCVIENAPIETLKAIVLKDNSSFGDWDVDSLAGEWDGFPLEEWGISVEGIKACDTYSGQNKELDTSEWREEMAMKFKLEPEEYDFVVGRLANTDPRVEILKLLSYGE